MVTLLLNRAPLRTSLARLGLALLFAGCSGVWPDRKASAPPSPVPAPLAEALASAVKDVSAPSAGAPKQTLVVDPLVDGASGIQTNGTRDVERRVTALLRARYPQFEIRPFSAAEIGRSPMILVGTFTRVASPSESFRICLTLVDLRSGKVGQGVAFARPEGVDMTPAPFFKESPVWYRDSAADGYIETCQKTKTNEHISQTYSDTLVAETLVAKAIQTYEAGQYSESFDLFKGIARTPGGDQLRVLNGVYLTASRLRRQEEAAQAFGKLIDSGFASKNFGVKFGFKPGAAQFDPSVNALNRGWLMEIARVALAKQACAQIVGARDAVAAAAANQQLPQLRAQFVKQQLVTIDARLNPRIKVADGKSAGVGELTEFNVTGC